jgi:hypothetical protein
VKRFVFLVALCGRAAAQPAPPADDKLEHAKQLYGEGKRYYDLGDYAHAIETWKQAYVLSAAPMLLFNIAQAHRLSGDCAQALKVYASYEREAGTVSNREELDKAKERCNREPTNTNPPTLPPRPVEPKPAEPVTPPAPTTTAALNQELGDVAPPPRRDRIVDRGSTLRVSGLVTGGAGVVLLTASAFFALRASQLSHDVELFRGEWGPMQEQLERDGKSAHSRSLITAVLGGLAIAGGGALYVVGSSRRNTRLEVAATASSAEVAWRVSF